jgi:hypothetical protein
MATYGANDALYGTGTFGTARYGRVTPIIAVSGVVGTGSIGTVTPKAEVSLTATGIQSTGSIGTTEQQLDTTATGVSSTGSIGTVEVKLDTSISGVSATGSVGSPEQQLDTTLTGVSATGSIGDVEEQPTEALESVSATGSIGTVTPKAEVSLTATGVSATGLVGDVEEQPTEDLESVSATGSIGTPTVTASASVMGAFNPDITSLLFSKVALLTASETSADTRIAAVEGASLAEQNLASSRVVAQVLDATGSSGTTNETLALTGDDQVGGSIQGAVGTGQAGTLSTSATVFDFEAVKELYSRRRTIFIARAA